MYYLFQKCYGWTHTQTDRQNGALMCFIFLRREVGKIQENIEQSYVGVEVVRPNTFLSQNHILGKRKRVHGLKIRESCCKESYSPSKQFWP
jgi:hypothetical protein